MVLKSVVIKLQLHGILRIKGKNAALHFFFCYSIFPSFLKILKRGELFPAYTDDFMNPRENAKPRAIQKTMKLVDKRQK